MKHLTNYELLGRIMGANPSKACEEILEYVNNDIVQLGRLTVKDLMKFAGIGKKKAESIVASVELGRRREASNIGQVNTIKSSKDMYSMLLPELSDLQNEEFWIIYLNHSNKIISKERISSGGLTATVVDIRMIFKSAVERLAVSIILAHNHPSGTLKPSNADIQLTNKIKEAGKIMDIQVLDHVILSDYGYYSFADEGML